MPSTTTTTTTSSSSEPARPASPPPPPWPGPAYASWSSRSIPASRSSPRPPGYAPGTMEILRSWGLEDTILRQSRGDPADHGHPADAVRPRDGGLHRPAQRRRSSGCSQPIADRRLLRRTGWRRSCCTSSPRARRRGPVRYRAARPAAGRRPREHHGPVRAATVEVGSTSAPRFLVGADGARSAVRRLLGIEVDELGSEGNHLATLFRADLSRGDVGDPDVLTALVAPGRGGLVRAHRGVGPLDLRHRVASPRPERPWPTGRPSGWPSGSGRGRPARPAAVDILGDVPLGLRRRGGARPASRPGLPGRATPRTARPRAAPRA